MNHKIINEKQKKGYKKWIFRGVFLYLAYLIFGALIPYSFHREPSDTTIKESSLRPLSNSNNTEIRACVVEDNEEALNFRLDMIEKAQKHILLSTFDIRPGESWDKLAGALLQAGQRGVEVKILVDGMYGMLHMKRLEDFYSVGSHPNIEIRFYNPIHLLKPWTFNARLHDKYLLVDNSFLLAGGRNIFDYFLQTDRNSIGYDREVFVYASSLFTDINSYFHSIWEQPYVKTRYHKVPFYMKKEVQIYTAEQLESSKSIPSYDFEYKQLTVPIESVSFLHNPTHNGNKEPILFYQLTDLMLQAEERVLIQTPYANYSDYMARRLTQVAQRVAKTELLINSIAVGDNLMASSDYLFHKEDIVNVGMDVYEFFGDHSSHSKSVLIDDNLSVIGSFNFDMRSTYLSTETMIVIKGKAFQSQLKEKMNGIRNDSLLINPDTMDYEPSSHVAEKEIPKKRMYLYRILGSILQLFRYLV